MTLYTELCDAACATGKYGAIKDFEYVYVPILVSMFVLTTILTLFSILIIWKNSTDQMSTYKWCLLNILLTSFILEGLLTLWMPVPIFPIFGGYNAGLLEDLPVDVNYIMLMLCVITFVNLLLAFCNFLLYQVAHLKHSGVFVKLFESRQKYLTLYLSFYVILCVIIVTPMWAVRNDMFILKSYYAQTYTSLQILFQVENTFGFTPDILIFVIILVIFLVSYIIVMLFLVFLARKYLKETSTAVTENVNRLQKSLYHTFLIQTLFSTAVFLAPLLFIVIISIAADDVIFRTGMFAIIIISLHSPVCSLTTILTIGVYRSYIGRLLFRKRGSVHSSKDVFIVK